MRRLAGAFILLTWLNAGAQHDAVKVRGQFLVDSIKIGKPFPYALAVAYPSDKRILFPDSTFQFAPYEFVDKQYFPTRSANGISRDSAIYYLNSFEIDSVQSLALPIFIIQPQDCTRLMAAPDFVLFQHLVTISTDSIEATKLPLKVNAFYEPVQWLFNYPLASIIGGIALVLLIVAWIIFGKRIIRYFKIKRMRKGFQLFIQNFTASIEQLKTNYSAKGAEQSLTLWKQYLENLEDKPFTKLTSKEILKSPGNESLVAPLATVDRLIYAGAVPTSFDAFYELKSYSEDRFYKKLEALNQPAK